MKAAQTKSNTYQKLITLFVAGRNHNTTTAYHLDLLDFSKHLRTKSLPNATHQLLASGHHAANARATEYRCALIERGLKPATVNRRLATLRALVKLAVNLGYIDWQLRPDKVRELVYRDTSGPTPEAIAKMLQLLADQPTALAARNTAILRLLFDLGLRRGEVAKLDLVDVDSVNDTIAVTTKGHPHKDTLTLPEPTRAALVSWIGFRGRQQGPLFTSATSGRGRRITGKAIWRMTTKLGHLVGTKARPHGFRHAAITEALNQTNGNVQAVQRFSRHKDVRVVLTYDDNRQNLAGQVAQAVAQSI